MSQTYKFKFRSDRFEVEVESEDQAFLMSQMKQLIEWSRETEGSVRLLSPPPQTPASPSPTEVEAEVEAEVAEEAPKKKPVRTRKKRKTTRKKPTSRRKAPTAAQKPKKTPKDTDLVEDAEVEVDAVLVAEEVKKSDYYKLLKKEVIGKANQLNRILMALYYARHVYGDRGFSTGILEDITAKLGAKLRRSNIAAQLKKNPDLFAWDKEPARGVTVNYKLKAKGGKTFEELLLKG